MAEGGRSSSKHKRLQVDGAAARRRATHIMSLYDKDLNLAHLPQTATLYVATRTWMTDSAAAPVAQPVAGGAHLVLPPPRLAREEWKPAAPPAMQAVALAEASRRIDLALQQNPEVITLEEISPLPRAQLTPLIEAWKMNKQQLNQSRNAYLAQRFGRSFEVLRQHENTSVLGYGYPVNPV
eukprot:m.162880 g.162880  ORF g.162880 m.162880 type:complete len:181 (+) comp21016_c0_seq5:87-629(+)